jgi:hypothetical protein
MNAVSLLLLAREEDSSIRVFRHGSASRVVHASIADLSCAGWRYVSGCPEQAAACAGGRVIPATRIAAVLCRISHVAPADLRTLHADDRDYAAAEMTAFLRAWLAQFRGVRCNEPTWMSLAGPGWHPLQWAWIVSNLGVPVLTEAQLVQAERLRGETARVSGSEVFGVTDPTLVEYSLRIGRAVKARSLAIRFVHDGEWRFASADPCPEFDQTTAAALLRDVCASKASRRRVARRSRSGALA